jgi:hypothetical protein
MLHRTHRLIHDPVFFGPPGSQPQQRYDDPHGSYTVLYLARKIETAFGETLVRVPTVTDVLSTDVLAGARSELATTREHGLHERAVCRRKSANLAWNWNVGLASPVLPAAEACP